MTETPALKYAQAAAVVRAQVADGTLKPGQPAPSSAHLARLTGSCAITCRRALRALITDGVLVPGASPNARPRVAAPDGPGSSDAARVLSRALAALRRANGLTQPALAKITGHSVTTVGHAETGRLWQSRGFWEKADLVLGAGGDLTRLHDAYRVSAGTRQDGSGPQPPEPAPSAPGPATVPVSIVIVWGDGTVTAVHPPAAGERGSSCY